MKIISIFLIATLLFSVLSCDKVENPYYPEYVDIDTTLLDGMSLETYKNSEWPTFIQNTNTNVNVLIEDFTGHACQYCTPATIEAEELSHANEGRVFVTAIHAGPIGITTFQNFSTAPYTTDFTNPQGLEIAIAFASLDPEFGGNPAGLTNRKKFNNNFFNPFQNWSNQVSTILNENDLNVNLQSGVNYFPSTRGIILHTEIDVLQEVNTELYQVVYLVEDSLVAPQKMTDGSSNYTYVHRDIHRGCIDGNAMGRKLTDAMKVDKNGNPIEGDKYYLNYSYKLPQQYNVENMHLLIYVYDNETKEILQVIKQDVVE